MNQEMNFIEVVQICNLIYFFLMQLITEIHGGGSLIIILNPPQKEYTK